MRSATECAPKKCRCGQKLAKPTYGYTEINPILKARVGIDSPSLAHQRLFHNDKVWHIKCKCGVVYVRAFHEQSNGCWMIRSLLPLMDCKEIVVVA